jgi:hypothetical protein
MLTLIVSYIIVTIIRTIELIIVHIIKLFLLIHILIRAYP